MKSLAVVDVQVLVLGDADDVTGSNERGHLFERFIAHLLSDRFGFEDPSTSNLNVTSEGIELDITAHHRLTKAAAIAECKAYSRALQARELTNFYGKLSIERFSDSTAFGLFCALPRLVKPGEEKAKAIEASDRNFKYLSAELIANELRAAGIVTDPPNTIGHSSDPAILITAHGVFGSCLVLDPASRTPTQVAVWAKSGLVPLPVLASVQAHEYSVGLPAVDAGQANPPTITTRLPDPPEHVIATVQGSASDFEYQFPAGPKYFVGRKALVADISGVQFGRSGSIVLNAQSGWGKSSLALKLQDLVLARGGHALVVDTRTADHPRYVVEVLRRCAIEADTQGVIQLPADPSWASLPSALKAIGDARWSHLDRPILLFFDQFENVFRDRELTRAFRDLALSVRDVPGQLVVGFAWKTDLVGWTEGHPYQLRDEIRSASKVVSVEPFGPDDVNVLLGRLDKAAGQRLFPDLRSRLRAYSQGLPWLLKKLADHILRELRAGATQEQLLSESLNVQSLFDGDLAELSPQQQEALRHVARYAPIAASEVTERYAPELVQSLVDNRLVVQVGDRLDTYWDTFRDFLNTGRVPIQDSYILRQTPRSVARLLTSVVAAGGSAGVPDLSRQLATSDTVIFNLSRELRLLGVTAYEPNRVTVLPEVLEAPDREQELRRRVASALRKHRAYSSMRGLAERSGGKVTLTSFARELPRAFPAVRAADKAWTSYARAFLFWITYAGLAVQRGTDYLPTPEGTDTATLRLLDPPSALRHRPGVPQIAPRRSIQTLERLLAGEEIKVPSAPKERESIGALVAIGAVSVGLDHVIRLNPIVEQQGTGALRVLLARVPGGRAGFDVLVNDPRADPMSVGEAIRTAVGADWTEASTHSIGGHFRAWAREAGLEVQRSRRRRRAAAQSQLALDGPTDPPG